MNGHEAGYLNAAAPVCRHPDGGIPTQRVNAAGFGACRAAHVGAEWHCVVLCP